MAEKKSNRVKTLSSFMKWVEQFNDGQYLFRGVSKDTHKIEASAYRRLPEGDRSNPNKLLKINKELIKDARLLGHDQKEVHKFSDLELLAELQHFGAATCLIDFSRNAQVALWYACQQSSSGAANGKVVAVRADDPVRFKTVIPKMVTEEDIDSFFEGDENGRYPLYQWQPKQLNNRVIAQQSVFIFGGSPIDVAAECIILKSGKFEILRALKRLASITEASIYPDFDGFARQHAQNKPYIEPNVHSYMLRGITAQMENNLDDAIIYYDEVISLQPGSPIEFVIYYHRGNAYSEKGNFDAAIQDFTTAIELDPENDDVYYNRGNAYSEKGNFDAAIQDFTTAIELNPENDDVYYNRGNAYSEKGNFDAAIQDFTTAIELNPKFANAYSNRGASNYKKGEFDAAIPDFTTAIELDPKFADAYSNRGAAYGEKGEFDVAIQDFTTAIELNPELADAYSNRVLAWLHISEWENAKADLTTAKERGHDIIKSFHSAYESVEAFEAKNGIKLPEDIAALLRRVGGRVTPRRPRAG